MDVTATSFDAADAEMLAILLDAALEAWNRLPKDKQRIAVVVVVMAASSVVAPVVGHLAAGVIAK